MPTSYLVASLFYVRYRRPANWGEN